MTITTKAEIATVCVQIQIYYNREGEEKAKAVCIGCTEVAEPVIRLQHVFGGAAVKLKLNVRDKGHSAAVLCKTTNNTLRFGYRNS